MFCLSATIDLTTALSTGGGANTNTGSILRTTLQRPRSVHWKSWMHALQKSFGDLLIGHGDLLMLTEKVWWERQQPRLYTNRRVTEQSLRVQWRHLRHDPSSRSSVNFIQKFGCPSKLMGKLSQDLFWVLSRAVSSVLRLVLSHKNFPAH